MEKAAWLLLDPSRPAWQRSRADRAAPADHARPRVRLRTEVLTEPDVTTIDGLPVTTAGTAGNFEDCPKHSER